jgi:hypothetical protein
MCKGCKVYKAQRAAPQDYCERYKDSNVKLPSGIKNKIDENASISASPARLEAGLFIEMDVCGLKVKPLVDTGVTVNIE